MIYPARQIANQPQRQPTVHTGWALLHESARDYITLQHGSSKFPPLHIDRAVPVSRHSPPATARTAPASTHTLDGRPARTCPFPRVVRAFLRVDHTSVAPTLEPALHRCESETALSFLAAFCRPLCSASDGPARRGCVDRLDRRCMRTRPCEYRVWLGTRHEWRVVIGVMVDGNRG